MSSLVIDYGGDEDQAIAGLLHDVVEDCGAHHEADVRLRFGERVASIVMTCTDGTAESKSEAITPQGRLADWQQRKRGYLEHLRNANADALLVSCCDKLHNARAIVADLEDHAVGITVFDRFTAKRDGTLRYYHSMSRVFSERGVAAAQALEAAVARMHHLGGVEVRQAL